MPAGVLGNAVLFELGRNRRKEAFVAAGHDDASLVEGDSEGAHGHAANADDMELFGQFWAVCIHDWISIAYILETEKLNPPAGGEP